MQVFQSLLSILGNWFLELLILDTIAQELGIAKDAPVRLRSGLLYTLNKLSEDGHCYAISDHLIKAAVEMLESTAEKLQPILAEMARC